MFIKNLDFLSPNITFHYKGHLSHKSIYSGLLSLVVIITITIHAIYFSLDIINRKNPNTFYFINFIEDAGVYQLNSTSLFHFINIAEVNKGVLENKGFDFTKFRIIGAQISVESFLRGNIRFRNYWVYGECDKVKDKELDNLIIYDFYENSACIKEYYDIETKHFYKIGDPNFVWPYIAHGTFHDNNMVYSIFIQKCSNDTIGHSLHDASVCKSESEIESFFSRGNTLVMQLYFVNNYINVLNYSNPNHKFIYRIETQLYSKKYTTNHININPTLVKTHNGLIMDNIKNDLAYAFDRNDVYIEDSKEQDLYLAYIFYLKNIMNSYERIYKRVQEVASSIGGLYQVFAIIAIILNYLYNQFIVLLDTELLINSSINSENKIPFQEKEGIIIHKRNIKILKPEDSNNNIVTKKEDIDDEREKTMRENSKSNNILRINKNINELNENKIIDSNNVETNNIENIDKQNKENKVKNKSFFYYFFYKISCGKHMNDLKIYENFRIKIISEEHLIRNHLNIYHLLKVSEKKGEHRRNSYDLNKLIEIV
jgi:hypothetical protein